MQDRPEYACGQPGTSHFWGEEGEVPLVEGGANALLAFKCGIKTIVGLNFVIGRLVALPPCQRHETPPTLLSLSRWLMVWHRKDSNHPWN